MAHLLGLRPTLHQRGLQRPRGRRGGRVAAAGSGSLWWTRPRHTLQVHDTLESRIWDMSAVGDRLLSLLLVDAKQPGAYLRLDAAAQGFEGL